VRSLRRRPDGRWELAAEELDTPGRLLRTLTLRAPALILATRSVGSSSPLTRPAATRAVADLHDDTGVAWGTNDVRLHVWTAPPADFGPVQGGPVVYGSLNWDLPRTAHTLTQASLPPFGADAHTAVMVGYGVSADRGRVVYDPGQ